MNAVRRLLSTTAGKCLLLTAVGVGGYEASQLAAGHARPSDLLPWGGNNSPSQAQETAEMTVKNAYVTPNGRVLLGDTEDYLDPSNHTIVVPASVAKSKGITAEIVGKTVRATGRKATYKSKPQLVASDITVK